MTSVAIVVAQQVWTMWGDNHDDIYLPLFLFYKATSCNGSAIHIPADFFFTVYVIRCGFWLQIKGTCFNPRGACISPGVKAIAEVFKRALIAAIISVGMTPITLIS